MPAGPPARRHLGAGELQPLLPADLALLIRHVLLIANPASRLGLRRAEQTRAALAGHGVTADVVLTQGPGDAARLAGDRLGTGAGAYDAVFVCGGDGTAMEVAGALAGTDIPVAAMHGGTGNLLARALGVPSRPSRAVPALLEGRTTRLDVVCLDSGHRFLIAGGIGIDVAMLTGTPRWLKRLAGVAAYVLGGTIAGLRIIGRRQFFAVRVTGNGEVIEARAATVMIANIGAVLNGHIRLGPDVRPDDGRLDVCIISARTIPQAVAVMWRMLRGRFEGSPHLRFLRGAEVRIETDPPMRLQADGELLGLTPVQARVEPAAACFLLPADGASSHAAPPRAVS